MDAFIGQIQPFGFNFAPRNWSFCDGTLIPISQNTALFSLLGTSFGGDGKTTFGLPKLNTAAICAPGRGPGLSLRTLGEYFGEQAVTLTLQELPQHTHTPNALSFARGQARSQTPLSDGGVTVGEVELYNNGAPNAAMAPQSVSPQGGGLAHNNMQPFLAMNYSISLYGVYPSFG